MIISTWADTCWSLLTIRPRTLRDYKNKYRRHIEPTFGTRELESVTRKDVQAWVLGLSPTIGKAVLPILKTLYREALNYGVAENNPTLGIRRKPYNAPARPFLRWADLDAQDYGSYNDLFRFMATHGLRWGEVQALTEADLREGFVHVTKSMYGPTKNAQNRMVPYMGYFNSEFPTSHSWAARRIKEVSGVSIHSLRYTYAYLLKSSGVHPQVAQNLLGHSTITLTMDLYTAVLPDEVIGAGEQLRNALSLSAS